MNYCSFSDLNEYIVNNLHRLPHNVDLIIGLPRSGMLPANLIALYLNKPYTDIDSFIRGHIYGTGERGSIIDVDGVNKVLVVDDSINNGTALKKAKVKLHDLTDRYSFMYAAIIATEKSKNLVDYYCAIVPNPRFFQWNIFHHPLYIPNACFDIDGVLCEDPIIDDDGPIYQEYIKKAPPKYIPTAEIHTLVTCRLEKYRSITEDWLKRNNVKYKHLVMLNMNTREERLKWGKHGEFKGWVYKNSNTVLFVESSLSQAKKIVKIAKKPVFCVETHSLLQPNIIERYLCIVRRKLKMFGMRYFPK